MDAGARRNGYPRVACDITCCVLLFLSEIPPLTVKSIRTDSDIFVLNQMVDQTAAAIIPPMVSCTTPGVICTKTYPVPTDFDDPDPNSQPGLFVRAPWFYTFALNKMFFVTSTRLMGTSLVTYRRVC